MLINMRDAKTHFSKFIKKALNGEEVIIARDSKPLVRLVPYTAETKIRKGGQLRGLINISHNFDAPLPDDLLKQFCGDDDDGDEE